MKNNELLKKYAGISIYHCQILWMGTKRGRPRGNHFPYIIINVDDAIYEVLTMPREKITI